MKNLQRRARKRLDERLLPLKSIERLDMPPKGWIRAIRDAIGMSGPQLGKRLGVSPQTVDRLEKSEVHGTLQLNTLRRVAEALDAQVVYALVPDKSLEEMVHQRARTLALYALRRVSHTMRLEAQETGDRDLEDQIDAYIRDELNDRDLWSS